MTEQVIEKKEAAALNRIYKNVNSGKQYAYFVDYVRFPFWKTVLSVSETKAYIRWTNAGSSANKNTLQDLKWIIHTIFGMTAVQFEQEYTVIEY